MKGVVSIRGEDRRYVFQAVHMLPGRPARPTLGDAEQATSMVFIGRSLDRLQLESGLRGCLAEDATV
jgi:G3E family GTPase